jgi:polar amino acid transport system substrate-binding protein
VFALAAVALATAATAGCGSASDDDAAATPTATHATAADTAPAKINTSPDQHRIVAAAVPSIADLVPDRIRQAGKLVIGVCAAGAGFPPQSFPADDHKTSIGSEVDIAYQVANVLGLKVELRNSSWEGLFVGLDSARFDVAFSNITITEERKAKYDFASYRKDDLAFEVRNDATQKIAGPRDAAGLTIAVSPGTNQEKIVLDWAAADKAAGLPAIKIKYFQDQAPAYLALQSRRIDAFIGPNPAAAYHAAVSGQTRIAGTLSGAGDKLQGLIGATTKKDNGLVKALDAALNHLIDDGDYRKVLDRWRLGAEALRHAEINPAGLPQS